MKFQSPKDWKLFQQSESGENDSTGAPVTLASNFLPVENENVQADIWIIHWLDEIINADTGGNKHAK